MTRSRINIPLVEEFIRDDFSGYAAAYPETDDVSMGRAGGGQYPWGLSTQRHLDIRTFNASSAQHPENWTDIGAVTFTTGPVSAYNHVNGLNASLSGGTATFISDATVLDLTSLGPDALITLALPAFPLASVNLSNCSLGFSSDGVQFSNLAFVNSSTDLVNGDSVATWALSSIDTTQLDLSSVRTVKLAVDATGSVALYAMALRLIDPDWIQTDVDFDTWNQCLRAPVSRDGSVGVVPSNRMLPPVWRSADVSGVDDPRPIDLTMGVIFYTGSQTATNVLSINVRGVAGTETSQLNLDGRRQIQLDGPQPGLTLGDVRMPRALSDLDNQSMSQLDEQSMANLDAITESISLSWLEFTLGWGSSPSVRITRSTSASPDYQWSGTRSPTLANQTYYFAVLTLEDTSARVQIFNVNQTTLAKSGMVFDTGVVNDSFRFIRHAGRVGWNAALQDGDARIHSIRPQSLMFAEYRSTPLSSSTPVNGARLYAHFAPATQLFQGFQPVAGVGGILPGVSRDAARSISGSSYRVDVTQPSAAGQGLLSNVLTPSNEALTGIVDPSQTEIRMSIWMPSTAQDVGSPLSMYLLGPRGQIIPLSVPHLVADQWDDIVVYPPVDQLTGGLYQLGLTYQSATAGPFWVDNINFFERVVEWHARSDQDEPWVPFRSVINVDSGGVVFPTRGTSLQVRARAHRQNAAIVSAPKTTPSYAELGRLVWPEDMVVDPDSPAASISAALVSGRTYDFNGSASTPSGHLIDYLWSFADGSYASGPVIRHTFPASAPAGTTYSVTLTVIDTHGTHSVATTPVGVA